MPNFHAWQRRTMRRADRQLWSGVLVLVAAGIAQFCIATFAASAGPGAANILTMLRYLALAPFIAGSALAIVGAWTNWRLRRDPIMYYYRCDGR
ncbi:hypothetical protein LF41_626 [Lysobacter dokdonensis DS-58]|uniref:Uncharacterized protein n=1 Tax=Lysobacter dokdonensis DS-58 TaxID=1300345 RepID=A0A0A2WK24_9GAMM|nr:hypothetical protein [Lysobacter dokdonensis]KGQ18600.1 hypothetical protein LF41_626 [Lysobacter dokdonensis DS-58]